MIRWPLRSWFLAVSILFSLLVVGGIAITTYVIVSNGMQAVAVETDQRIATTASKVVEDGAASALRQASTQGLSGASRADMASDILRDSLPRLLGGVAVRGARFALYDSDRVVIWTSDPSALWPAQNTDRSKALQTNHAVSTLARPGNSLSGLVSRAQLPVIVLHEPVKLLDGKSGVLDVTYLPMTEESVIDAVRLPMAILAISAIFVMILLMQTSMAWVLTLVDNLRKAADSVDAGRLDARLPESGANEIGDLARSVNRLIERLQRRSTAQSRFIADASHELATPVAGIRGYTSILRAWGGDDPRVREEAIDAIDRESRRMARLSGDLLNLLHADQGLVLKTERFDVNELIRDRVVATAGRWVDKDLEYHGPDEDMLVMQGDPDRIEDVVSILLDNAAKYTPAGGRVTVLARRRKDSVIIEVADTGRGIPPHDLPRIFDRFYRSEASRAAGEGGFGLGLAIAMSIVQSMGGTISAESTLGEGTTFTVVLPRGRL